MTKPFANAAHLASIAPSFGALQHKGPRPLPLFLTMVQQLAQTDPHMAKQALAGLRKLQAAAEPVTLASMPVVASCGTAQLHDYGGSGPAVVFVPSLINPPDILDLTTDRSLLRWLSAQNFRPYLINWGGVTREGPNLSIAEHVSNVLLPLLRYFGQPVHLVGYCLGGTMAVAAAQLQQPLSLTTIASPWHFSGYADESRVGMAKLWNEASPIANQLGVFPLEFLQAMFWQLDPAGTVAKYARFAEMANPDDCALFMAMERWVNEGAALTIAAARELLVDFFANDFPGTGQWCVGDVAISPAAVSCPMFDIISSTDRIVPAVTSARFGKCLTINRGHVGMVAGSRALPELWQPLREWLSQSQ